MAVSENIKKVLDSTNGYSEEFKLRDNRLTFRLKIEGTALANIKAFMSDKFNNGESVDAFFLKIFCSNWNGASVVVEMKTSHVEDQFTRTDDIFTRDSAKPIYY
jgi:hypothetical protein